MNQINLSENIIRLRKQRKLTQEEMADHLGVTKASVSKWENGLSLPDILLLPQIASLFDVSVDELIGYTPQLSKEQIQKIYTEMASGFAKRPFEEVITEVRKLTRKYYSCYPFLIRVCILYANHYMLASKDQHIKLLDEARNICDHITDNCSDVNLCSNAVAFKAYFDLMAGRYDEVIESLGSVDELINIATQNQSLLIQAYIQSGDIEHAKKSSQFSIFINVSSIIGASMQYISANQDNPELCGEILRRAKMVVEAYNTDKLNPNAAAMLSYQGAVTFAGNKKNDKALTELENFAKYAIDSFKMLKGHQDDDAFFTDFNEWVENYGFLTTAPRDIKTIIISAVQALSNPAFSDISTSEIFLKIKSELESEVKHYE